MVRTNLSIKFSRQAGFSLLEYIIALTILMIAFVAWLQLTATAVNNGRFVQKLADVKTLSSSKVMELSQRATAIVQSFSPGQSRVGSLEPDNLVSGYFDELNESGCIISRNPQGQLVLDCSNVSAPPSAGVNPTFSQSAVPKYLRQWMIVRDQPTIGDISVYVSVAYKEPYHITRLEKIVKTDGFK